VSSKVVIGIDAMLAEARDSGGLKFMKF